MKASDKRGSSIGRCTDVGKIRAANEDSMGDLPIKDGHVLIVADGMGGYRGGALASHLVVEAIEEYFRDASIDDPPSSLRQALHLANERVYLRGQQDEELSKMGSTCVLACIQKDKLYIGHVGDSRIYLARRDGSFLQLTKDHTVVQHFVDVGLLSQEEAENHPDGHILSRALGPRAYVEPEVSEEPVQLLDGDRIVLCSDGLTKMLSDKEIEEFLKSAEDMQQLAKRYVEAANDNGGEDNVTVIVFEYLADKEESQDSSEKAKGSSSLGSEFQEGETSSSVETEQESLLVRPQSLVSSEGQSVEEKGAQSSARKDLSETNNDKEESNLQ